VRKKKEGKRQEKYKAKERQERQKGKEEKKKNHSIQFFEKVRLHPRI
jgi:hypothetical protein